MLNQQYILRFVNRRTGRCSTGIYSANQQTQCLVDAANLVYAAGLGISLPAILIIEARWRLWNVRSGPVRRGLSISDPGVAVAMLILLRQPF